ncbi:MAG: hypothetical protein GX117_03315 [Candidatus Hydrogenedentes bacterium]|nr:hypothetical protein [Candidatus Hydrogenedentota bacterium]
MKEKNMCPIHREFKEIFPLLRQKLEKALSENLMPFWAKNSWDQEQGGFLTRLDRYGRRLDDTEKVLMMQVRMMHSLSAAHRYGIQDQGYLTLAGKAFDYVRENFWDEEDGGFYFSVNRDGSPRSRRKNTDFHAYALTGLAEYYLASKRPEVLEWACRVFELLMDKAKDRDRGFIEGFDGGNWPALNAEQMNLGDRSTLKTIDMHTNMLEALVFLFDASGDQKHGDALMALLQLICRNGIHSETGCTITVFNRDWEAEKDADGRMTTSYGLNVELAWLIWEALDVLNSPNEEFSQIAYALLDHALAFGFDHDCGGLAANGPMSGSVLAAEGLGEERLYKTWWAQAELLNALSAAFLRSEKKIYLDALIKTVDWIECYQMDHRHGDWYEATYWDSGAPVTTDKGREFKTSFHAGRALIRTIHGLQQYEDRMTRTS